MKGFLQHTLATLLTAAILLELLLRIFQFPSHVLPEANVDGDRMLKPGIEGRWSAGGMGEFRGHYRVNAQGWNSVVDYSNTDSTKIRVAIIGDSFIEGLHFDVEQSVGRIMETKNPQCQVHEYGRSGGNIADYALVYEKWVRGNYDFVFVLLSDDDLLQGNPNYMSRGEELHGLSTARKLYYSSHLLRYFGLNHGLGIRVREILNREDEPAGEDFMEHINHSALGRLEGCTIICDRERLHESFRKAYPCLLINQQLQPFDCGFAGHWNMNGRNNTAHTLLHYMTTVNHSNLSKQ
jgi:hypothetical protein